MHGALLNITDIVEKSRDGGAFGRDEIVAMLSLPAASIEAMMLMASTEAEWQVRTGPSLY